MEVPAVFATWSDGGLEAVDAWFEGTRPVARGAGRPFEEAVRGIGRSEERTPAVVVDMDSLSRRRFTEGVVKSMRVRGCDLWFMTWIETADDLFDAFNTTADMVMGPLHAVASGSDLEDIYSVSDSFIPTVFIRNGRSLSRRNPKCPGEVLDGLADVGFYRACVLDTDGSITDEEWSDILEDHPSAIPFTRSPTSSADGSRMWVRPLRGRGCRRRSP